MEQQLSKILGEVPFPFCTTDQDNIADTYYNSSMVIIDGWRGVDLPLGSHAHSSYEFTIPRTSLEIIKIDNKTIPVQFNKIEPINPGQQHGTVAVSNHCNCFAWNIDEDVIKDITHAMYGKTKVTFDNSFIPVNPEITSILNSFMDEYKNEQPGMDFVLDVLVVQMAITLLRQVKSNCLYINEKKVPNANPNINRTIEYLNDNYQCHISLQDVAHIANMSPYHFLRLFKRQTGKTPYTYLLDTKIEKAKALLRSKKYTVTEVCFMCGFSNTSHFATTFKRKVGMSPSDYSKL